MSGMNKSNIVYPEGKDFIFTIFDDTDVSTLEYIKPIYSFFEDVNIKTTKSVWPIAYNGECNDQGSHTLEYNEYAKYIKELHGKGFEIGYHGPTMISSAREDIVRSFQKFYNVIGSYPRIYAAHSDNRENLYWGASRFSFAVFRMIYSLLSHETYDYYQGHIPGSKYYWGDLAAQHIDYVRNFTYNDINLLNISTNLPYFNKRQQFVRSWFNSCDVDNVEEFNRLLNEHNQDKLKEQRGVCIISTHLGKGFIQSSKIHRETEKLLLRLSKMNGWFVPVSTALDFLKSQQETLNIPPYELFKLELKWFVHSLKRRTETMSYKKTEVPYLLANKYIG